MRVFKDNFKESALKAILASLASIPVTGVIMNAYATFTVSLDTNNVIGVMTTGSMINTAFLVGILSFLASYIRIEFN